MIYFLLFLVVLLNYSIGIDMYRQYLDKYIWNTIIKAIGLIPGIGLLAIFSFFVECLYTAAKDSIREYFGVAVLLIISLGAFSQVVMTDNVHKKLIIYDRTNEHLLWSDGIHIKGQHAPDTIPIDPICSNCPFPGKGQTVNIPIAKHAERALEALQYLYGTDKSTLTERAIWGLMESLNETERNKLKAWFKKKYPADYKVYAWGMLKDTTGLPPVGKGCF